MNHTFTYAAQWTEKIRRVTIGRSLSSDVNVKIAFFEPTILAVPEDQLRKFLDREPALAEYRFTLSSIRRNAPHMLPASEQALLDKFQPEIADWQDDLYQQVIAATAFGTVQTPPGPLDVLRQRDLIATNVDGRVREEGQRSATTDLLASAISSL